MNNKSKINTGFTLNNDIISIMDEYLKEIGNTNRSRYIEKLIKEDFERRGIKVPESNKKQKNNNIDYIFEKIYNEGLENLTKEELDFISHFSKEVDKEDKEEREKRKNR